MNVHRKDHQTKEEVEKNDWWAHVEYLIDVGHYVILALEWFRRKQLEIYNRKLTRVKREKNKNHLTCISHDDEMCVNIVDSPKIWNLAMAEILVLILLLFLPGRRMIRRKQQKKNNWFCSLRSSINTRQWLESSLSTRERERAREKEKKNVGYVSCYACVLYRARQLGNRNNTLRLLFLCLVVVPFFFFFFLFSTLVFAL